MKVEHQGEDIFKGEREEEEIEEREKKGENLKSGQ